MNEKSKIFFSLIILFIFTVMIGCASASDANQTGDTISVALDDSSQADVIDIDLTGQTVKDEVSATKDVDDSDANVSDEIDSTELKNSNELKSGVSVSSEKPDVLGVPADQELLGATLVDLQTLINQNGNTKTLTQDYVVGTNTADYQRVTINKNLVINGNNHRIDANGRGSIFYITGTRTITFNNLIIANAGTGQNDGGAIYCTGACTITFNNCQFINNKRNGDGGVLYSYYGGTYTFTDCTFIDNSATGNGGAIFENYNGAYTFTRCTFDGNVASTGAAFNSNTQYTYTNSFVMSNCKVYNNAASSQAALYLFATTVRITDTDFENNTGYSDGGAIHVRYSGNPVYITGCNFTNNKATSTTEDEEGRGGAVRISSVSTLNLGDCIFDGNSAMFGGALYAPYVASQSSRITNCEFYNNIGSSNGGAIYWNANGTTFSNSKFERNQANNGAGLFLAYGVHNTVIDDCTFNDNEAMNEGGAIMGIYNENNVQVTDSTFNRNVAINGGAIALGQNSNDFTLDNCQFNKNHASGYGGCVYFESDGEHIDITNSHFDDNFASSGGAIHLFSSLMADSYKDVNVIKCTFHDNNCTSPDARYGGSAIGLNWASDVTISECTFDLNHASSNGAVMLDYCYDVNVDNCNFTNNYAGRLGGAFYAYHAIGDADVTFTKCAFDNNTAARSGGAIATTLFSVNYENLGNVYKNWAITDCNFTNNKGELSAGALYLPWTTGLVINNIPFDNNTAGAYGAMYWSGDSLDIHDVNFTNNKANGGDCGALYIGVGTGADGAHTVINKVLFENNTAYSNGGALSGTASNVNITNDQFKNNSAWYGGAIYWNGGTNVNIDKDEFIANSANNAGAVDIYGTKNTNIHNSVFVNNTATNQAGAVWFNSEGGSIYSCNFTNNVAGTNAGAIILDSTSQTVRDCKFESNVAGGKGGAVYDTGSGADNSIFIRDSTFTNNQAYDGGGAYISDGRVTQIYNDTFIDNIVTHNGGGAYVIIDAVAYVDYDLFNNTGIAESTTERITKSTTGSRTYIYSSLFQKSNIDYYMNVSVVVSGLTAVITVNVPADANKSRNGKVRFEVTYTNQTGSYLTVYELDNFEDNPGTITLNLPSSEVGHYDVIVQFSEDTYLMKQFNLSYDVTDPRGDFEILQGLINDAIANHFTEIDLTRSYTFTPGNETNPLDFNVYDIEINAPLIINGHGWTINALGYCRIFNITGNNVVLNDLKIINGANATDGGAIYWNGNNGTVERTSFINNTAASDGGAIYYAPTAQDCKVLNSTFENNNAGDDGGAIDWNATRGILNDSTFINNKAEDNGGALCREENANGGYGYNNIFYNNTARQGGAIAWMKAENININHYTFVDNTADISGGAIYVGEGSGNCIVNNSYFEANNVTGVAGGHGGAIEWYAKEGAIYTSTFNNNHAYKGGAVFVGQIAGDINITDSIFTNNSAVTHGGAIDANASSVIMKNSEFYSNAAEYGGALYVGGAGESNSVEYCLFIGNNATENGGAIDWAASNGNVLESTFEYNHAKNGGAVYVGGLAEQGSIVNSTFNHNSAEEKGGAVTWNATIGRLTGSTFFNNSAQLGGATYRGANSTGGFGYDNTYISNKAELDGGAIYWNSAGGNITYSEFHNNTAGRNGGAVYVGAVGATAYITDAVFENNDAGGNGGAVDWAASNGHILRSTFEYNDAVNGGAVFIGGSAEGGSVINSTFNHNTAEENGGAVDWNATIGRLTGSTFFNNSAKYGGATYRGANSSGGYGYENIYISNHAEIDGGAIDWNSAGGNITHSEFYNNTAGRNGGAVYVGAVGATAYITDAIFDNNTAGENGGAVDWAASNGYILRTAFDNNNAVNGGAVYVGGSADSGSVINSTFNKNTATENGGAIDWNAAGGNITNSQFSENTAVNGGAVYVGAQGATTYITDAKFEYNEAENNGGAVNWAASNGHILTSEFNYNTANNNGGAVFIGGTSVNGTIINSTFNYNTAGENGGAIDWNSTIGKLTGSNFTFNSAKYGGATFRGANATGGYGYNNIYISNHAEVNGGAIDWNATGGNITHSKFYNNTAGENGGALFVGAHGATAYITEAVFENNRAENRGGAIDIYASNTHIINSNFTTNSADYGGAVFAGNNALVSEVANSTFVENSATYNGGAIDWNASSGTIIDSNFDQNTAQYGGAVFVGTSTDNGNVIGSSFIKNSASIRGGAIDWNGSSGQVLDSIFEENEAVNGGALYLGSGAAKGHIENSTFISNRADRNKGKGGAILFHDIDEVYVGLSNFTSNSADHGGAMYIEDCDSAMIETSEFTSNSANNDGAIHWQGHNGTLRHSEFTSNTATQDAGAIGWKGIESDIYNVTFNKNTAGGKAGAIYWVNVTDDKIYNVTFSENQAFEGGAIYWLAGNGTISDAIFDSNVAFEEGGAIYIDGVSGNALRNSTFNSNKATGYFNPQGIEYGDGGALYITNSDKLDLEDLEFNKNAAALRGGAICINGSDDSILHALTFNDNSANKVGGTIYWNSSSNATITNISIEKSTAHDEGGAIYLIDMEANLDDIKLNDVTSNYASGGAIYANGNVTINNASISNFKSLNDVATAILFDGGNSSLSNSTLEGNNAIVINEDTTVYLTENTIRDTPDDGYAVLNGGTLYLKGNDFDDVIINAGVIETQTYTIVLNNKTLVVAEGTDALLNASIVDDTKNNDIVCVDTFKFRDLTSGKDIESYYSGRYNYGTYESVEQGKYIISANDAGLKKNEIKTGTLLVKANNMIDINITQVHEGEKVTIKAELLPADPDYPYEGNVTLVVSGKPYVVPIEDGVATLILYNLSADTYSLTATYPGDEYHFNATNSTFFVVNLRETFISVVANSVLYGQNVTAIATTNANGTVTFLLNGRKVAEIVNGTAKWNITGLEPGKYEITVIYPGNEYFTVNFNETSFEVYKNNATIDSIDFARVVAVGNSNEITVTMGNVTSGMIIIEVNGVNYTAPIVNKVAKLNVSLPIGNDYAVRAFFTGDNHYNATSKDADYTFDVTGKNITVITIDAISVVEIDDKMIVTLETNSSSTDWTVYVNNNEVTVNETNQFVADTSVAGNFVIIAMLAENEQYSSGYNTTVFTVIKHNSTVSIDIIPDQIHYVGDSFVINITNSTAANVTINGKVYEVNANGNVNIDTSELAAGEYIVSAVIVENSKYYGNSTSKTFRIVKYNSTITSVEVTPAVEIGQNLTVTVTMGNITDGTVEIELYGINHTAIIENGVATLSITATKIGNNFPVNAYFLGDYKHNASSKAGNSFNVTGKYKTVINISVDSVVVVDSIVIVTVTTNTTAQLIVEMDGNNVTLNETGQFIADTSVAGNHIITATTEESELYYGGYNSTIYNVIKHNSTALIEVDPVHYVGTDFTINVTSNATVNVTINGKSYAVGADGTVEIDTTELAAGEYIVIATVTENDKYYGNVTSKPFTIVKYDTVISDVNIQSPVINVAYNNTITVTMGNVTSGTILIGINGTNYSVPINNNVATLSVGLPIGKNYNVTAYFLGDDRHNPINVTVGSFEVTGKNVTEITIDVESVVVVDSRVIVTVTTNTTAQLTVQVNGVNVTLNETNQFVADTSQAGTFTITALAPENGDYASGFNATSFTVIKHNSTALIEVDPVHYVGTDFTINVTSNTTVNVTINGKSYAVGADGTVEIDTTELAAGEYIVIATVTENDKYYGNVTNNTFTIIKYNADIDVVTYNPVVNVAYNNTITVRMGNVTSGNVIIAINGTNYSVPIYNSVATLSVGLPVGKNYTVDVYFLGDDRYNPANVTAGSFEVTDKNVTIINITVAEVVFVDDNLVVTLDTNSSADLIVYVNGKEVTLENNQFVANTTVSGTYTIVARTAENEYYAAGFNSTTYEVIKYNSTVSIEVETPQFVESVFTIIINNNTAVNVTINGKSYAVKADGTVDIDTTKLEAGEYIVNAVIAENYKYNGNSSNATFTIVKYASVIDSVVVTPEVEIGQNVTVTVTMGNVTDGTVLIEVYGLNYSVPIVDGVATLNIAATVIGNDTPVMAYFEGDYKHNASSKAGNTFNVTGKYPTVINITVDKVVKVGDQLIVTVETNSNATLYVEVNGVPVELNETGQFIADTSVSGNYTIIATTEEVDYYYSGFNSTTFEVIKHNSTVSIDVETPQFVESDFTITISNNTAVNVTINGKSYDVKADGTVDIDTTQLEAGEYIVTATIVESGMYYGNTTTATFNVVKYNAVIESVESSPVVSVGHNNTIVVTMGNVTSGVVTIDVNGQNYTAPIVDGVARLNVSLPVGKNYPVKAYFLGDYKYNATSMAGSPFEVTDKNVTEIIIDVDSILVVDSEVYVTVTTNSSSSVVVEVNGRPVSVVDNKFKADTSEIGKYTIVARTAENEYYAAGYNSTVYTVIKHNSTVDIIVNPVNFVEDSFTITVNSNATPVVTINGKECTVKADGTVDIDTTALAAGEYIVTATVVENDKYYGNSTTSTFKVVKYNAEIVSVDCAPVVGAGHSNTIVVTMGNVTSGVVTIDVNGQNYTAPIVDGVARLNVSLPVGKNYPVKVYFLGDYKYNATSKAGQPFEVTDKNVTVITIEVDDVIVIDSNAIVTVKTNSSAQLYVYVNGKYQELNSTGQFVADTSAAGTFMIVAMTAENEDYSSGYNSTLFEVIKYNSTVDIIVDPIHNVGDAFTINITSNATPVVTINGKQYTVKADGTVDIDTTTLAAGEYIVTATVTENGKYYGNSTNATFMISKSESKVNVTVEDTPYRDNVEITVNVPVEQTGSVLITVEGKNYTAVIKDGVAKVNVTGLVVDRYTVDVTYLGDDSFDAVSNSTEFNVTPIELPAEVIAFNVTVEQNPIFVIGVDSDFKGNVTIAVDDVTYDGDVKLLTTLDKLTAGDKTATVTFYGDGNYNVRTMEVNFTVSKLDPTEGIDVIDQGNGTVVVVVPGNATGNVTIVVGNDTYNATVINGTAIVNLTNVTPGKHNITVIYSGDENHTNATVNATVTIPKFVTPMDVTAVNINVGDVATITVTVPEDATGEITIEIDGVTYTEQIINGNATFTVENLTAGIKTVAVDYVGDNNYTGNHTTANFTVSKIVPEITVVAAGVDAGNSVVIEITAPSDVEWPVLVDINGKGYYVNITDGQGTLIIPDMAGGDYNVTVKYLGDAKYLNNTAETTFKVSKVPSTVAVTADNITVGEVAIIEIAVPEDATGNVTTVIVNGETYTVPVVGGKGILVVRDLPVGEYTVQVTYNGDGKYETSNNETTFKVNKIDPDIKVIDQGNGTVVVVVPGNATGNVTIVVGNDTYNATVINGTAVVNITNITAGVHNITVIYSGDENHTNATINTTIKVSHAITPISINVTDINVGDVATIVVTVNDDVSGNITIEIDGKNYTEPIVNGIATFTVENLTAGEKSVFAMYEGDEYYAPNHAAESFKVSKLPSEVSATIVDTEVGNNVTITVKVPSDATGQVLIDIDGVGYYVNVTDGTGSIEIPRLPSGKYEVGLTYTGDDKYLPNTNTTTFNVNKVESFVIPTAHDIYVGEVEIITFQVPADATGNLTVVIAGDAYTFTLNEGTLGVAYSEGAKYTVAVSGGNGELAITGLPEGEYVVSVKYNGDGKYLQCSNETTFKVNKIDPDIKVIDQGNGTVVVVVPGNATGNVTIVVGNNTYNATVINGTAAVDLTNETPGVHNITVIYSGDENHTAVTVNATVNIPKHNTPIKVDVSDIRVGDTAVVTVTVPEEATGIITIEINAKNYTAEIKNGKAIFKVNGLSVGDKTVAVTYDGDENYVGNFTTGQFTVSKRPSTVSATSKDITVGKDEVITVTVPKDATGRVLVDINGVGYYGTIVNGKAKVLIPELPSGKYTAKVTYEGDGKYLPSTTTTKFTVTKVKAPIIASGDEIDQGQDATVVVNVPKDATGTITITVDGKKYTAEVKNGKAVFDVAGLTKGDYKVTASYSGDKKYEANDTVTDIEVYFHDSPDHHGDDEGAVGLSKHATGNPIFVLLLVLLALGSTQLRRFKK